MRLRPPLVALAAAIALAGGCQWIGGFSPIERAAPEGGASAIDGSDAPIALAPTGKPCVVDNVCFPHGQYIASANAVCNDGKPELCGSSGGRCCCCWLLSPPCC